MTGTFLRIGPQSLPGEIADRWGQAPGMLHVLELHGSRAAYRSSRMGTAGPGATMHLLPTEVLATGERGPVWQLDRRTWQGTALAGIAPEFTVPHAALDSTGALVMVSMDWFDTSLTVTRRQGGTWLPDAPLQLPGAHYVHDFAIVAPHGNEPELLVMGLHPLMRTMAGLEWDAQAPSAWLVRERCDDGRTWLFETEPCYAWHAGLVRRSLDDRGRTATISIRTPARPVSGVLGSAEAAQTTATGGVREWSLDLRTGASSFNDVMGLPADFPVELGDRLVLGLASRREGMSPNYTKARAVAIVDADGGLVLRKHPPGTFGGEFIPVPTDEGIVLAGLVTGPDASELLVLDPDDLAGAPLAQVEIQAAIPPGLHAAWLPGLEEVPH